MLKMNPINIAGSYFSTRLACHRSFTSSEGEGNLVLWKETKCSVIEIDSRYSCSSSESNRLLAAS